MRDTIWSITKSCKTCQTNKKRKLKYGHLPAKAIISTPWEALCVDLVGPYVRPHFRKGLFLELALPVLVRVPVLEWAGPRSRTGIAF
jgi:hypothetical protein